MTKYCNFFLQMQRLKVITMGTWIMKKYDIQQILVAPRDIQFVFSEQWHQDVSPPESRRGHVVLLVNTVRRSSGATTAAQ